MPHLEPNYGIIQKLIGFYYVFNKLVALLLMTCVGFAFGSCLAMQYIVFSSFTIIILRNTADCFTVCSCCRVTVSVLCLFISVCDCGIPSHTHLCLTNNCKCVVHEVSIRLRTTRLN